MGVWGLGLMEILCSRMRKGIWSSGLIRSAMLHGLEWGFRGYSQTRVSGNRGINPLSRTTSVSADQG